MTQRVTRLAPSPTGALHLGNARTFVLNYLLARKHRWRIVMRMEDLDGPRTKAGAGGSEAMSSADRSIVIRNVLIGLVALAIPVVLSLMWWKGRGDAAASLASPEVAAERSEKRHRKKKTHAAIDRLPSVR